MKILLLGGTSFFGIDIARFLKDEGHDVTIFSRGNRKPKELEAFQFFKGDRTKSFDLERANKEIAPEVVIDNIGYTGNDLDIAIDAFPKIKRFVFTSTVSVYRYRRDKQSPIYENMVEHDLHPEAEDLKDVHWNYARGKLEAEKIVVKAKVPWTIVRPPVVYGPYDISDRGFWYLLRLQKGGPIILPDGGLQSFKLVFSHDLAQAYVQLLGTAKTEGKIYNLVQNEVITFKDFIQDGAKFLGKKPEFVSVPAPFSDDLAGPYNHMVNFIPDDSQARKDFGFSSTPWQQFGAETARWFSQEWKGDEAKLLDSRKKEIALCEKWRNYAGKFSV